MWQYYNPNPRGNRKVGDCVIRALSKALNQTWEQTYAGLVAEGLIQGDLPNADTVWSSYLFKHGFRRSFIPEYGLGKYTVADFARDNKRGLYLLSMPGQHIVCVCDGDYFDTWDSGEETPSLYWVQEV